jgi:biotin-(acetyl-CoA carboxylase) ligase
MRNAARQEFDLAEILNELLAHLEATYLQLRAGQTGRAAASSTWVPSTAWANRNFSASAKPVREGIIRGVDPSGRLVVEMEGQRHSFGFKEIAFVWE